MKPESIKSVLRSYLKEKQPSLNDDIPGYLLKLPEYFQGRPGSSYTFMGDIDGTPCLLLTPDYVSEPFHGVEDLNDDTPVLQSGPPQNESDDLEVFQHQSAGLPWDEHNVPLEPQLDELAIGVGRRLSQISDEFNLNHLDPVNSQASSNGNRYIQFKECVIRAPVTCNFVQISIIRTRAADSMVNATWRTSDKSAKAGLHYVNSGGSISFAQDEEEKTIEVEIIREEDRRNDVHFAVELFDAEGIFNTLTVYIVDDSRMYPEEKQLIKNIFSTRKISMSEIVACLRGKVNHRTFKAALQCLCSNADTIPKELVLGAELLRLTMPHAPFSMLTSVFCDYFSYLPELEDIANLF